MIIVDTDTLQKGRTCIRSILRLLDSDPSILKTTHHIQTHEQRNKINSINQNDSGFDDEDSIIQSSIWISSRLCRICLQTRSRTNEEKSYEEDLMDKPHTTFKEFKERAKLSSSSKPKTSKEKRQDKINKLQDDPKLWNLLEQYLNEDLSRLNKSYVKFRSIYQSGRKYSAKDWVELMADLLDSIDWRPSIKTDQPTHQ